MLKLCILFAFVFAVVCQEEEEVVEAHGLGEEEGNSLVKHFQSVVHGLGSLTYNEQQENSAIKYLNCVWKEDYNSNSDAGTNTEDSSSSENDPNSEFTTEGEKCRKKLGMSPKTVILHGSFDREHAAPVSEMLKDVKKNWNVKEVKVQTEGEKEEVDAEDLKEKLLLARENGVYNVGCAWYYDKDIWDYGTEDALRLEAGNEIGDLACIFG